MKVLPILIAVLSLASANTLLAQEAPSVFTYNVGKYKVVLLQEVQQTVEPTMLLESVSDKVKETMPSGKFDIATNAFLLKTPEATILVDAGLGLKLQDNLKLLGVAPEEVDFILLTHMHFDHIGGLLKDSKVVFPNATLCVSAPEAAYWTSADRMNSAPENQKKGFINATKTIAEYSKDGKCKYFDPSDLSDNPNTPITVEGSGNALSGIVAIEAFGHTPGHTVFLVKSENESLLIWGDLTHVMPIQMPYPEVAVTYDTDPELAVECRKKILELVAANKIPIAGMHIPYPAIGKVDAAKEGYKYTPALSK